MARIWKKITGHHDPDPQAVARLKESEQQLEQARSQSTVVNDLTSYLSARREKNHFGDDLTIAFTPRRRHV